MKCVTFLLLFVVYCQIVIISHLICEYCVSISSLYPPSQQDAIVKSVIGQGLFPVQYGHAAGISAPGFSLSVVVKDSLLI